MHTRKGLRAALAQDAVLGDRHDTEAALSVYRRQAEKLREENATLRAQLADEATARDNLLLQTICRLPFVLTQGDWDSYLAEHREQWLNDDRAFGGWVHQRITAYLAAQRAVVREKIEKLKRWNLSYDGHMWSVVDGEYFDVDDVLAALDGAK